MYTDFKKYNSLVELYGDTIANNTFHDYLLINHITNIDLFINDYTQIKYTSNNILNYFDLILFFDYKYQLSFIKHIVDEYIIKKMELLEELKDNTYVVNIVKSLTSLNKSYHSIYDVNSYGKLITNELLIYINKYVPITELNYMSNMINDDTIKQLTKLTTLWINDNITDMAIVQLTNLHTLNASCNTKITNASLPSSLTELHTNDKITIVPEGIQVLYLNEIITELPSSITKLYFNNNNKITVEQLNNLPNLQYVDLGEHGKIDKLNESIEVVHNFDRFDGNKLSQSHYGNRYFINLRSLRIGGDMTYDNLILVNDIKYLTNLTSFSVYDVNITDEMIYDMTNLTSLDMEACGSGVTNDGIKNLVSLTELSLGTSNITYEGLKHLPKLRFLSIQYNTTITDNDLKQMTQLTYLELDDNTYITDDGLKHLINLKELSICWNDNISDEGIKDLINLESLMFSDSHKKTKITNKGLQNLYKLREVSYGDSFVLDNDIAKRINENKLRYEYY